ncbi:hypothetical protein ACSAMQ_12780, partial [Lysobacter sp. 1R34A]
LRFITCCLSASDRVFLNGVGALDGVSALECTSSGKTLVWALHRRHQPAALLPTPGSAAAAESGAAAKRAPVNVPALRQMIDLADFDHIAAVLRSLADPPAVDDDELVERLADPAQREAVQALRRARWGGGDGVAARAQLRQAFAQGPSWQASKRAAASPLPPLYPPRS